MKFNTQLIKATAKFKTPFFAYDIEAVKKNYKEIKSSFSGLTIYYALKCNPHQEIVSALQSLDSGFEIASMAEAKQLIVSGVDVKKIYCFHPIKSPEFLQYLAKKKIDVLAVDSYEEIDKIAKFAPKSKIVVRVNVDNKYSRWDLSGKFGLPAREAVAMFKYIKSKGLISYGLTTHVGSQCENVMGWLSVIDIYKAIIKEISKFDIKLKLLSLGGGLPVRYRKPVLGIDKIGNEVTKYLQKNISNLSDYEVSLEPGRAIVATSGILVTSVFGLATRNRDNWAYIETGTYNGLVEAIETEDRQFYEITVADTKRPSRKYHIGGPSCVSLDTPFKDVLLPELRLGDRVYILSAGAYLASCAAPFNGFPTPREYFLKF